jgi:hypothetical protein
MGKLGGWISGHTRLLGCVAASTVLAVLIWLVLDWLRNVSGLTTLELFVAMGLLVLLSGVLVSVVLVFLGPGAGSREFSPVRHAATGIGLLFIGTVLALAVLPESSTGTLAGGVGFLPPARTRDGFTVALLAQPKTCGGSVPLKFVAYGSNAYWTAPHWQHEENRHARVPFVLVLPGEYGTVHVGVGPNPAVAVTEPLLEEAVHFSNGRKRPVVIEWAVERVKRPRALTIVSGRILDWAISRRPLIVETSASWITHRGLGSCNLQLPALTGASTAQSLEQAFSCKKLAREVQGSCTVASPEPGGPAVADVAPWLQTARGETAVTGTDVSASDSDPQPAVIRGTPRWTCATPGGVAAVQVATEGSGELVTGGDCHAAATLVSSPWHRDLILVLLGAFVAVGVHMLFQGMIEGVRGARAAFGSGVPDHGAEA